MSVTITKDQAWTYVQTVKALADAIREAGSMGINAGLLYTAVMSMMSLDAFERTIGILTSSGLVKRERSGLLVWVEPVQRRD